MRGWNVRLRNELSNGNADEDEHRSRGRAEAETLAHDEERRDPGKDRLEGQQQRSVG